MMALKPKRLQKDIKSDLDSIIPITKSIVGFSGGIFIRNEQAKNRIHKHIGKELSDSIDLYYKEADIECDCDTPLLQILPGITTPAPGTTTAPINPVPLSHRGAHKGKYGKGPSGELVELDKFKLRKNIKGAFDAAWDFATSSTRAGVKDFSQRKANKILASKLSEAIDIYIKECFVEVETETPDLEFLPGATTTFGTVIGVGKPLGNTFVGKHFLKGGKVINRDSRKLFMRIFKTLNDLQDKKYPKSYSTTKITDENNKFLSKRLSAHIHEYTTNSDVMGEHIMENIQMAPGARTIEFPPSTAPAPLNGSTTSPGNPIPATNIGCFGAGCFCGSEGKVV